MCFRCFGRRFCFGQGSDVSSMFRTSVVQVVEQMNKKVDHTRLKKRPTVRVGHFSSKAPNKNTLALQVTLHRTKSSLHFEEYLVKIFTIPATYGFSAARLFPLLD